MGERVRKRRREREGKEKRERWGKGKWKRGEREERGERREKEGRKRTEERERERENEKEPKRKVVWCPVHKATATNCDPEAAQGTGKQGQHRPNSSRGGRGGAPPRPNDGGWRGAAYS